MCCITLSLVLVCSGRIQIHNLSNLDILFVAGKKKTYKKTYNTSFFMHHTCQSVTTEKRMLSVLQHQTGSAVNLLWTDWTVVAPFPDAFCNGGQILLYLFYRHVLEVSAFKNCCYLWWAVPTCSNKPTEGGKARKVPHLLLRRFGLVDLHQVNSETKGPTIPK